jgi:hypothetical protein
MTDFCLEKAIDMNNVTQSSIDFCLTRFTMTAHSDQVAQKGNFGQSDCECSRNKLPHLLFGPVLGGKAGSPFVIPVSSSVIPVSSVETTRSPCSFQQSHELLPINQKVNVLPISIAKLSASLLWHQLTAAILTDRAS